MDKVAIIILNWNSEQVTLDCLHSLKLIDYEYYKIFLVDNGSKRSISRQNDPILTGVKIIDLKENHGFTGGNNIGISVAQAEYNPDCFLLLNNDTIVERNFLRIMVHSFNNDSKIGVVVPKIFFHSNPKTLYYAGGHINLISGIAKHYGWKQNDAPQYNISKFVDFANGCSMLIKKDVVEAIGVLNDNFFANIEDVEYSYRITKSGFRIYYNHEAFLWHKEGFASKKNIGQWFRIYLSTRNIILFQRSRCNNLKFVLFILFFSLRWVLYMNFKLILLRDFKSAKAIFYGVVDGFSGKLRFVKKPVAVQFK